MSKKHICPVCKDYDTFNEIVCYHPYRHMIIELNHCPNCGRKMFDDKEDINCKKSNDIYCSTLDCPFKKCKKHIRNLKSKEGQFKVSDFICEKYRRYVDEYNTNIIESGWEYEQ